MEKCYFVTEVVLEHHFGNEVFFVAMFFYSQAGGICSDVWHFDPLPWEVLSLVWRRKLLRHAKYEQIFAKYEQMYSKYCADTNEFTGTTNSTPFMYKYSPSVKKHERDGQIHAKDKQNQR